jgi:GGDEF domain-containing protein
MPADVSAMTDRFQFGAAVRSRSWEWLFALRKRLNLELQLVDDAQVALLSTGAATERNVRSKADAIDGLLSNAPGVRLAISSAIRTRTPQAASVDRLQTVVVPVTLDRVVSGALIVARRTAEDQPLERVRSELELVGFWLTNAIEAHLQSPPAAEGDLERLSALCRLLDEGSRHRSDRDIVATFIETLAVWHDLEGYGYVETTGDGYARDVALPGADPARTPTTIARAVLPELDDVMRLAKSDIDRLGFSNGEDVVLARVGEGDGSWLVAISGSIQSDELMRLGLYVSLLDQAVMRVTQAATAQVLTALSSDLLGDAENPEEQARRALAQLQNALGMERAAFTVTSRTGTAILHVGASYTAADLTDGGRANKVVIIRRDPQQYAMALVGSWSDDHHVTQQESRVAHAAADLLESWVRRLVHQSRAGNRRATRHDFDEVLERAARNAVQVGIPVTALVISFADMTLRPDVIQSRVVRIRELLRAGDLVGRLDEGDLGVLLHDAVSVQAEAPVTRVRQQLEREGVRSSDVFIGMATRKPGESTVKALAQEARQRARYHASDN